MEKPTLAKLDEWSRVVSNGLLTKSLATTRWTYTPVEVVNRTAQIECGFCGGTIFVTFFTQIVRVTRKHTKKCACRLLPTVFERNGAGRLFWPNSNKSKKRYFEEGASDLRRRRVPPRNPPRREVSIPIKSFELRSTFDGPPLRQKPTTIELRNPDGQELLTLPASASAVENGPDYVRIVVVVEASAAVIADDIRGLSIKEVVQGRLPRRIKLRKPGRLIEDDPIEDDEYDIYYGEDDG